MRYYHIQLSEDDSILYTIIPLWGKYGYKRLPVGVSNLPAIFQEKMNELFQGLNSYVYIYMKFNLN